MIESICIDEITPLHAARYRKHVRELAHDMRRNGWQGRPLLVIERDNDYLAWTGSHRIAAAKEAGIRQIPCYSLSESKLIALGFEADWGHVEDRDRLEILRKVGDENAISIMWQENRS